MRANEITQKITQMEQARIEPALAITQCGLSFKRCSKDKREACAQGQESMGSSESQWKGSERRLKAGKTVWP